jgi:DNA-binding NtrC family response regulator
MAPVPEWRRRRRLAFGGSLHWSNAKALSLYGSGRTGNERELRNVVVRAAIMTPGPEITVADLIAAFSRGHQLCRCQ